MDAMNKEAEEYYRELIALNLKMELEMEDDLRKKYAQVPPPTYIQRLRLKRGKNFFYRCIII